MTKPKDAWTTRDYAIAEMDSRYARRVAEWTDEHLEEAAELRVTSREAHTIASKMLFDVLAVASDCDARAEGLASAFMARKSTAGRRAAIARNISALLAEMGAAETMARDAKNSVAQWAEKPGLPAPLVDLAPHVFTSVADTLSLARARIKMACHVRAGDTPDMDIMGSMGAASHPDAQPGEHPETAAEQRAREDAMLMAEMLS